MKILVVEDEQPIASAIIRMLAEAGHIADWAPDGETGERDALAHSYACIILDVLLPKRDGWTVLENLRRQKITTPILMLTALESTDDKVKGLETGADDYLAKPFEMRELIARVNALTRRTVTNKSKLIEIADLRIDRETREVTRSGQAIALTRREYDLLEALAVNEGRTLSRETIQERVWSDEMSTSNTVDVYIGTLRKKIDQPFEEKLIHTAVGFGYVLRRTQ